MQRIKLTIQFDGTDFCGWQSQQNGRTVQDEVEKALSILYCTPCKVTGVGRTDEGVHARAFVAHFDAPKTLDSGRIVQGLNRYLPCDVSVLSAQTVGDDFDARKSALSKTYVYRIYVSRARKALLDKHYLQIFRAPDIDLLRQGAQLFVGTHDFCAFAKVGYSAKTTVRTVYSVTVCPSCDQERGQVIELSVCGNAFLYNMVRNIVGCLLFLCQDKLTLRDIEQMLATGKRHVHFKTVSGRGLELSSVSYPTQ